MRHILAGSIAALAAFAGLAAHAQDYPSQVRAYLERGMAVHEARGYRADGAMQDIVISLRMGDSQLVPVMLERGRNYRVYAACDADCSDLDMEIYGADGAFVEKDIALDATPFVQITPRTSGRHYVRVWLAACESEPCFAALRLVSGGRPETRAPPPGEGGDYAAGVTAALNAAGAAAIGAGFSLIDGGRARRAADACGPRPAAQLHAARRARLSLHRGLRFGLRRSRYRGDRFPRQSDWREPRGGQPNERGRHAARAGPI